MPANLLKFCLVAVGFSLVALTACAPAAIPPAPSQSERAATPKQDEGTPEPGGLLRAAIGLIAPSLDVISEGTIGTHIANMPVYNTLMEYQYAEGDKPGFPSRIVPGLAEKWEQSKDGRTYTFSLRRGVQWHDGQEFTSADAEFSIRRIIDPPPKTPSLRQGWYKGSVEKMEAPDKYTFRVTLKEPNSAFIKLIAAGYTPMVPKHVLQPFNSRITVGDIDKVVGTGPFKLVRGNRDVSWHFDKNQDYWKKDPQGKKLPYLDGIDVQVVLEESSRVAAFRADELDSIADAMPTGKSARDTLAKVMGDRAVLHTYGSVGGLGNAMFFNTARKPFDDARVRKAVLMGIDWRGLEKVVYEGQNCIGGYMPPKGEWGLSCEEIAKMKGYRTPTTEDLAEAKKLLAEAGYPSGFDVNVLTGYGAEPDRIAQVIQPMLAEIGVRVSLRNLERTAYYNAMNNGDFEMNPMGALASIDDPNDHLGLWVICVGGRNYGKYCDQKVEQLFQQQSRELDPEKRKKTYRELEMYLLDQAPHVNTWGTNFQMVRSYVKGWVTMAGRHSQMLRETVWLDK